MSNLAKSNSEGSQDKTPKAGSLAPKANKGGGLGSRNRMNQEPPQQIPQTDVPENAADEVATTSVMKPLAQNIAAIEVVQGTQVYAEVMTQWAIPQMFSNIASINGQLLDNVMGVVEASYGITMESVHSNGSESEQARED